MLGDKKSVCIIPGCGSDEEKRGFCVKHYMRYYRLGKLPSSRHSKAGSPEYIVWWGIVLRCFYKKSASYHKYGGRGITMDIEWFCSFERFLEDVGPRPGKEYQMDRERSNENYNKENCRWLLGTENSRRVHAVPEEDEEEPF